MGIIQTFTRWAKPRHVLGALALASVIGAQGCAGERDPINRVQIGAFPKTFFVGEKLQDASDDPEFYFRTTVVDVSSGAGSEELFTSSDAQPTVRIRWEITENQLNARLSYELIANTDLKGTNATTPKGDEPRPVGSAPAPSRTTTDGQIVAAFKIEKQFDIRRVYNPQTGEEDNIIGENDEDRAWPDREYIRVDWSQNLVTDAYDLDAASQAGIDGGVKWDPIAYNVTDPADPDAPSIDFKNGYLDFTNKAFAAPQIVHDDDFGDFPACQLTGEFPRVSCNPSEVKMRLAFKKVVDKDYEPLDYDGTRMDMFGFFTNDRYGYDRRYGVVDNDWHRFISRWNVFDKSHVDPKIECNTPDTTPAGLSPHRDDNGDGTEDECTAVGRGSRCDEFTQLCTIPMRDRKIKTTPWHVNREFPEDLFASSQNVVNKWSDTVRVAILTGRLAECRRTHEDGCEAAMGWPGATWSDDFVPPVGTDSPASVDKVFVLCHNPVDPAKGDDPVCGDAGTSPRMGDLRYNFFSYVTNYQVQAPWGIMVDAEDPLTGEKVSGSVNQYGATLDRAAGQLVDLVDLLNGVTPPDQFIQGKDVSAWVQANRMQDASAKTAMSATELSSRLNAFDPKSMAPYATSKSGTKKRVGPTKLRRTQRMNDLAAAGKLGQGNGSIMQRFTQLKGSNIEAKMVTPDVAQMAGMNPNDGITPAAIARAAPFTSTAPRMRKAMEQKLKVGRAQRHMCRREAPETDHLLGLARKAQAMFGTVDPNNAAALTDHKAKIFQWARESYSASVYAHEFGHSVGLRHNFAGTFDSLNYDNKYWQLRTKNGSVTKACAAGNTDGNGCIGPRYSDPITDDEINGGIGGFATSSVMDYPGDQQLDMFLIGKYDRAAVRFGYGGTVDVWNAPGVSVNGSGDGKALAYAQTGFSDSPGLFGVIEFPVPDKPDTPDYVHYSQYASKFGLVNNCQTDADSPLGTSCQNAPMDIADYRDLKDFVATPDYAAFATTKNATDAQGRVRRGYMFSSDEYSDSGNIPSFAYDAGADPYEQIRFLESAYENRYILDSFRRNRTMFNSWDVTSRIQSHYLDAIQAISKTFAFAMVLDVDDPSVPSPQELVDGNYGPAALGASVAFDLYARMLTRPEPGAFCSTGDQNCSGIQPPGLVDYIWMADPDPLPSSTAYGFSIPLGQGRYIHNDFDYDQGYWWSDYQKQVGSFYDKTWAIYYLSEAFDDFLSNSKDDFVDGRYKNVNFATVYPTQTRRLFAALMTGDIESYAAEADTGGGSTNIPNANVIYPSFHDATTWGTRSAKPKLIDPAFGWNEQLYAMVWGSMFFPTTWSNEFINDSRITALENEQISWPAAETITFIDPLTSITYRAHTTGTEKVFGVDKEMTIGARMIDWANNLLEEAYLCEVDAQGYYVVNTDGTPKLKLDKNGKAQVNPDFPGADADLKRYVENLDTMRQLVTTFVRPLSDALPDP